jgi:hypothetical protein
LKRRLDNDRARVLRRTEVMDIDRILSDSQDWWKIALAWVENPPQSPKTINARVACQDQDMTHPSIGKRSSSSVQPTGREVTLSHIIQKEQTAEKPCTGGVDYGDMGSGMSFRIGAVLDGVGCRNLKTLELVHQPHEVPDTNLPPATPTQVVEKDPPQSPKTITASVSCQDQDMIFPSIGRRSSSSIHPQGREITHEKQTEEKLCTGGVDYGDILSGMSGPGHDLSIHREEKFLIHPATGKRSSSDIHPPEGTSCSTKTVDW